MTNHTKEYSIAVITHATEKSRFEGLPEKRIADLLGVDPSNIPKYKSGASKLSTSKINALVEKFGPPKLATGRYLITDIYQTVDDFIKSYDGELIHEFAKELGDLWQYFSRTRDLESAISNRVLPEEQKVDATEPQDESDCFWMPSLFTERPLQRDAIMQWFYTQLVSPPFREWTSIYENWVCENSNLRNRHKMPSLKKDLPEWSETSLDEKLDLLCYCFGKLAEMQTASFNNLNTLFQTATMRNQQEIVISGKVIYEFESTPRGMALPTLIYVFITVSGKEEYWPSHYSNDDLRLVCQSPVKSVQIKLFLNKEMHYRIYIEEKVYDKIKTSVIRNVRPDLVVAELNKLSRFYGIAEISEYDLKVALAENGGYIPGVEVL